MNAGEVGSILNECNYADWHWRVGVDGDDIWMQVSFADKYGQLWHGRKWRLSEHMTSSEVVQTAFLAVMTAVEHEAREAFLYKGKAIFGPHFDVECLVTLCNRPDALDVRTPPTGRSSTGTNQSPRGHR